MFSFYNVQIHKCFFHKTVYPAAFEILLPEQHKKMNIKKRTFEMMPLLVIPMPSWETIFSKGSPKLQWQENLVDEIFSSG
jgi:hypothetical protein